MKRLRYLVLGVCAVMPGLLSAQQLMAGTSGPFPVVMEMLPSLPDHTVYRPADLDTVTAGLAVLAWGNGGCINTGDSYRELLSEIASWGFLVAASGEIGAADGPQSTNDSLSDVIDWAVRENVRVGSPLEGQVNPAAIAVGGHSCGGLQAIAVGADSRVSTVMVLNSGVIHAPIPTADGGTRMPAGYMPATEADLANLHTPTLYLAGGPSDQAWANAEIDFDMIAGVPVFYGNLAVGHGGTWREPQGGRMGTVVRSWLQWQLQGSHVAAGMFSGGDCRLCRDPDWIVKRKALD